MDTSAKYTTNQTEIVGAVKCGSGAITQEIFLGFSRKLRLAYLQLLMNTSAKFEVNRTETVGGVVRTSIFNPFPNDQL